MNTIVANSKPQVSIVIPNYNHARYLPERMESVLGQTFQNFEVIILDDCSTDNSREIIESYRSNPHVSQIIYNETNSGGVFKQWKKGISLAKGELIWIAESDDKCEKPFLGKMVESFDKFSNLSLAFCKSFLFNDKGEKWTMDTEGLEEMVYDGKDFIATFMSRGCPMLNASSCLFSKNAYQKIDDRYTEFRASGDRMFWTLISECGNVSVVNERLNYFRKHDKNTTAHGFLQGINQREFKVILDYILGHGYISKKEYKKIQRTYLKKFVFELLQDKHLKQEIYKYWDYTPFQQFSLHLEAYYKTIMK